MRQPIPNGGSSAALGATPHHNLSLHVPRSAGKAVIRSSVKPLISFLNESSIHVRGVHRVAGLVIECARVLAEDHNKH